MIAVWLAVQGVAFLLWTVTAFRILFHLRRRGVAMTGQPFPGPVTFLRAVRDWLRDPAERAWRIRLAVLTTLVIAMSLAVYTRPALAAA